MHIYRLLTVVSIATLQSCAGFAQPLSAKLTGDGRYWILLDELTYENPDSGESYTVPKGFATDLASVPQLFWTVLPPCDKYSPAAVVHDYLYTQQLAKCDRKCADKVMLDAMKSLGVSYVTRYAIYTALRVGGKSAWDNSRRSPEPRIVPPELLDFEPTTTWKQLKDRIRRSQRQMGSKLSFTDIHPLPNNELQKPLTGSCLRR